MDLFWELVLGFFHVPDQSYSRSSRYTHCGVSSVNVRPKRQTSAGVGLRTSEAMRRSEVSAKKINRVIASFDALIHDCIGQINTLGTTLMNRIQTLIQPRTRFPTGDRVARRSRIPLIRASSGASSERSERLTHPVKG